MKEFSRIHIIFAIKPIGPADTYTFQTNDRRQLLPTTLSHAPRYWSGEAWPSFVFLLSRGGCDTRLMALARRTRPLLCYFSVSTAHHVRAVAVCQSRALALHRSAPLTCLAKSRALAQSHRNVAICAKLAALLMLEEGGGEKAKEAIYHV